MKKNKKSILGVTLVEILIGIVISSIMMAAMYASYTAVNNSFQKVTDKAKVSQTGRTVLNMLVRDIRMAGFKYYGDDLKVSDPPILISKTSNKLRDCDKIDIVYGDVEYKPNETDVNKRYTFIRYKVSYYCKPSTVRDKLTNNNIDAFSVFKSKVKWSKTKNTWDNPATDTYPNSSKLDERTYPEQFIEGYVQDMIFNAIDANGNLLKPPPSPTNSNKKKLYDIKTVDIALAVRSKNPFYNDNKKKTIFALTDSSRDLTRFNDRFLRETLTVTAYARNVGLE